MKLGSSTRQKMEDRRYRLVECANQSASTFGPESSEVTIRGCSSRC